MINDTRQVKRYVNQLRYAEIFLYLKQYRECFLTNNLSTKCKTMDVSSLFSRHIDIPIL